MVEEKERGGAAVSRGPLTQIPVLGARSGVWNDMGSPDVVDTLEKAELRPYQGCLNPVPQSRSGKRGLGNMRGAAWRTQGKEVGLRPYAGHLPRFPISGRETGSGTTWGVLQVDAMVVAELRPYEGRLPKPAVPERAGSGTT